MTPSTPPPWTVYLLRCADDTLYTGIAKDVDRRLVLHLRGKVKYTRGRLPVLLIYSEPAIDHGAALRREAQIKRLARDKKLALAAKK